MTSPSRSPAQPNRAPKPRWHGLFTLLFALVMHTSSLAQDRAELVNRSSQPWTLALVEGTHASVGSLTLVDKFTGKISASLAKVGDAAILPARAHLLVVFNREGGYMNRDFILKDTLGYYAEDPGHGGIPLHPENLHQSGGPPPGRPHGPFGRRSG